MKRLVVFVSVVAASMLFAAEKKETGKGAVASEHKILAPAELTWGDAPQGLPAGAKMAVLDGDPTKRGSFTVRLQSPAGYKISPHTHPTAERVTVISGTFHLGMGDKFDESAGREMGPGSFAVLPAGMKHFAWSSADSIVQIHSEGPFQIKYVNPADDPRNAKK